MKFIDLTTKYKLTTERVSLLLSTTATIMLCAVGTVVVAASVGRQSQKELDDRNMEASSLYVEAQEALEASSSASLSAQLSQEAAESLALENTQPAPLVASLSQTESSDDTETDNTDDQTESSSEDTTTEEATTTTETTSGESEYYTTVYSTGVVNLRTGPGTGYDLVRELPAGSTIDVVARTSDGWYRTYNGNYVLAELTTTTPPTTATSATTSAASTTAGTTAAATTTTAAPTTTTTAFTETPSGADTSGMTYVGSCTITFYSPQHMGAGTYCVDTATGTTCCQGRTVAADWSVIPAGTTIYVANDPLGGDGYYVVEDRGSAVTGNHIDIFADDISSLSTTTRDVYIVN